MEQGEVRSSRAKPQHATRRARKRNQGQQLFIFVTLAPMVLSFLLFWIYPILNGFWGSFTRWQAFSPQRTFIGLSNYRALFRDPIFLMALKNTFLYTLMYLPAQIVLALGLALMIEGSGRLRPVFRTVYFLPVVTSVIATALIWKWLYQPTLGLFNQLLALLGLPAQRFLLSRHQALPSIAAYAVWKDVGYTMVLFMAGLNGIDRSYFEAARVDGANRWQIFWKITLPLLRPTLIFVTVTGLIYSLRVFDPIFVMSSVGANSPPGGPNNATMVVSVYQWQVAFKELNLGYGSAMGMVLFVIILLVTLMQARFLRSRWEYD